MLIIISPSKTLELNGHIPALDFAQPIFPKEAELLIKLLRKLSVDQLIELMDVSPKLAQLNQERFYTWRPEFSIGNSHPAIFAFRGEVYNGIGADTLSLEDLKTGNDQLRILSGLYGVIRPLDLIRPYRLEMGTSFKVGKHTNLYPYWQQKITTQIREDLDRANTNLLVNLASVEYFKVLDQKKLKAEIITPEFREGKNGTYKMVTIFAKKARGLMTRYILQNKITEEEEINTFNLAGYCFNPHLSQKGKPVFTRG